MIDRFLRILNRANAPDRIYYWLLDRLTDNNGWRPLSYREAMRLREECLRNESNAYECACGMAEQERTGHYPEHAEWCDVGHWRFADRV